MNYIVEYANKDKIIFAYLNKLRKYPFLTQEDLNKAGNMFIDRFENKMVEIFNSHTCESFKLSATQFIRKIFNDNLILSRMAYYLHLIRDKGICLRYWKRKLSYITIEQ